MELPVLPIIQKDKWLQPVADKIALRHNNYLKRLAEIKKSSGSLRDYANAYLYFGLHRDDKAKGWWFREWLPGAHNVYIFGDFNNWQRTELPLQKGENGEWHIFLPDEKYKNRIQHKGLYKILVFGNNGLLERIPAYVTRVYEDTCTHNFSAQIWQPKKPFDWKNDHFRRKAAKAPIIYEAHIGMAQEKEGIGSYTEFTQNILPRIKKLGYNTIQLMAIAEHPYYGSFGYHVSNFYAPSSRFGTPEELKELIRTAHEMGIAVIMDLVHSHYIKNFNEGINELDGTDHLYSLPGEQGNQPYWDSKTFDYGKPEVEHFLLSNLKYWLEEFHFDGFRFDGVTSMIYYHHGYIDFDNRDKFFDKGVNEDALKYLTLANTLIHSLNPSATTIAEDVSGMPGMCIPPKDGGIGFDYRLGMAVPDFWIKMLEDIPDEEWNIWDIWNQSLNRLPDVKTIAYAESHDQAMVGDKTIAFRLMDKEMYDKMDRQSQSIVIDRGIALHKMIRLFTISTGGQGYLNFMGNEFGHPEWIDFPREGNGWSYAKARRMWSLADNTLLRYNFLQKFDKAMISLTKKYRLLTNDYAYNLQMDTVNKTMVYTHGGLLFILNWDMEKSIPDYKLPVPEPGRYHIVLNSDDKKFGGFGRTDDTNIYFSFREPDGRDYIRIYNTNRTALILEKMIN